MNGGVEILLARMETHPEEFFKNSRWAHLVSDFERFIDKDDFKKLEEGFAKCRQQEFTEIVMTRLVGEEKEDRQALKIGNFKEVVNTSLNEIFDEAYANHSIDSFTYTVPTTIVPPTK